MSDDRADEQMNATLAEVVRTILAPLVAADGGEIALVGVRNGVAEISLGGACAGCPGQTFTAHDVVLPALKAVDASIVSVKVTLAV